MCGTFRDCSVDEKNIEIASLRSWNPEVHLGYLLLNDLLNPWLTNGKIAIGKMLPLLQEVCAPDKHRPQRVKHQIA